MMTDPEHPQTPPVVHDAPVRGWDGEERRKQDPLTSAISTAVGKLGNGPKEVTLRPTDKLVIGMGFITLAALTLMVVVSQFRLADRQSGHDRRVEERQEQHHEQTQQFRKGVTCFLVEISKQNANGGDILTKCGFIEPPGG